MSGGEQDDVGGVQPRRHVVVTDAVQYVELDFHACFPQKRDASVRECEPLFGSCDGAWEEDMPACRIPAESGLALALVPWSKAGEVDAVRDDPGPERSTSVGSASRRFSDLTITPAARTAARRDAVTP